MMPQEEALASMEQAIVTAQDALVLLQTGPTHMAFGSVVDAVACAAKPASSRSCSG
jgi:hypothetical protein